MMQLVAFSSSIVYSALVVVMVMGSGGLSVVQATTLVDDILTTVSSTSSSSSDFVHWMAEHFHFQDNDDEKTKTNGVPGQSAVAAAVPLQFFTWMQEHSKSYETTEETHQRLQIWNTNDAFIAAHNTQHPAPSYTLGHNHFSDLTHEEYRQLNKLGPYSPGLMTPVVRQEQQQQQHHKEQEGRKQHRLRRSIDMDSDTGTAADIPAELDWVQQGAIVPVKNQGLCGSCWAFSAIVAIEGAHYLDTGNLTSLSEQELVDCDTTDLGCGGGLMDNAFLFDENSTGICSEQDYPYVMHRHWLQGCLSQQEDGCTPVNHTRVETFYDVDNTVEALVAAIAQQPVSVAIEADQQTFQFYKSGVYDDPACGDTLDHGVAAVGYGTLTAAATPTSVTLSLATDDDDDSNNGNGKDYFKVRNSWGASWGDNGYILMSRSVKHNVNGTCGILGFASVPKLRDDYD